MLGELKNPKVNLLYDDKCKPYLSLEFDTHVFNAKGMNQTATIKIHKIKLDYISLNHEVRQTEFYNQKLPRSYELNDRKISFNLDENEQGDIFTVELEEE